MIKPSPRHVLTRADYFHLHGYPDQGPTYDLMIGNADVWLERVNELLELASVVDKPSPLAVGPEYAPIIGIDQVSGNPVASGRRPAGVNANTANAAAASTHLTCEGGDVQDLDARPFAVWCVRNEDLLDACGLWMEDPRWTGGRKNTDPWVHLQTKPPRSRNRIYVPVDPAKKPATDPLFYKRNGLMIPAYLR